VAWPEKAIVSPTFQVVLVTGVSMTAVGASLPGVTVTVLVWVAFNVSVTVSRAVYEPAVV
jgi:hypothetical protein